LLRAATDCKRAGLEVISSWVTEKAVDPDDPAAAALAAASDLDELTRAELFVCFGEDRSAMTLGRGGRHVELGYALALEMPIVLVGSAEHVFHRHPLVRQLPNWEAALSYVLALVETSAAPRDGDA
jgi:nucleoside 2-deoxyribosyltransferase